MWTRDMQQEATSTTTQQFNDIKSIVSHIVLCLVAANFVCFYEGYDCSYLKPEAATIRQYPNVKEIETTYSSPYHHHDNKDKDDGYNNFYNSNRNHLKDDQQIIYTYDNQNSYDSTSTTATQTQKLSSILEYATNMMEYGTRGMGRGTIDRADSWYQNTYFGYYEPPGATKNGIQSSSSSSSSSTTSTESSYIRPMREIPSYNEVMQYHRQNRVPRWKQNESFRNKNNNQDIVKLQNSIITIYNAVEMIDQLKNAANNYDWDEMSNLLQSQTLKYDLEVSCNYLRSATQFLDYDARQDIGFDWGSCAWRHCGAQADAQESLAELYNSIGLFEPFECLFTIDIIERSLRDIINVIPNKYQPINDQRIPSLKPYIPYVSQNTEIVMEDSAGSYGYGNGSTSSKKEIDSDESDFLEALNGFKNDYSDDLDGDNNSSSSNDND